MVCPSTSPFPRFVDVLWLPEGWVKGTLYTPFVTSCESNYVKPSDLKIVSSIDSKLGSGDGEKMD